MTTQPEALRLADKMSSYSLRSGYAWHCHKAAAELRRLHNENETQKSELRMLSCMLQRQRHATKRNALLEVLMLCQQAGLHKHILNTGESLASVVDAAIKAVEGVKHD